METDSLQNQNESDYILESQYDSLINDYNFFVRQEVFFLKKADADKNFKPSLEDIQQYEQMLQNKEMAKSKLPHSKIDYKLGIAYLKQPKPKT